MVLPSHRSVLILLATGTLLVPCPAAAQDAERKTFMDFSDDVVSGSIDGEASYSMGSTRMRKANRFASRILERRMRRKRPNDLKLIRQAGAADVVVVQGSYDRVQEVLRAVKIKHVVIPPHLVAKVPFMSLQTVMVNCPGHLSPKAQKRIRRFVKHGGHLVTTDWALTVLQRIFPGYVARGGRNTKNDVVKVHLHEGSDPLLNHVRAGKGQPRWWLEASSYPIRILDRKRVKVLISSQEMRKRYGHAPIAVAFRYDDGRVMHMTSHFYLQQSKLRGQREKAKGSAFAKSAGLDAKALARLRKQGLDKVQAGALNSAYSMQQITANVLADKARANKKLLQRYKLVAQQAFVLRKQPATNAPFVPGAKIAKKYILQQLKRQGSWVQVRTLFGHQGWALRGRFKVIK
jgi:hypothetical protein